jgi:hypothetical protein
LSRIIRVPEEEWEKLKKDVDLLKKQDKAQQKHQHIITVKQDEPTKHEMAVLEYIREHPNVSKQDVVDYFDGKMSRQLVYKTVDSLVQQDMINDKNDSKNRQIHRLTINQNSILYSVIQDLDQFENAFAHLSYKAFEKAEEYGPDRREYFEIVSQPYVIFFHVFDSYIVRSTLEWPKIIHDRDMLKKLNTTAFARLTDIQAYLPKIVVEDRDFLMEIFTFNRLGGTVFLDQSFSFFEKFALMEEAKPVFDAIWNINREIQKDAYPEPHMFEWNFKYGVDGWEKLLELQRQHPDETILNSYKVTTDAILSNKE